MHGIGSRRKPARAETGDDARYQWRLFMPVRFCLACLLIGLPLFARAEPESPCLEAARTQTDLNVCADAALKRSERELELTYHKVLKAYADDKVFIARVKKAQRAWLKFRDAELDTIFPHKGKTTYYGSAFPMCFDNWTVKLTRMRIEQLKQWLNGVAEGEICAGSIRPAADKR
jgi:uncharacterized protein YecT (DUF1311 family)